MSIAGNAIAIGGGIKRIQRGTFSPVQDYLALKGIDIYTDTTITDIMTQLAAKTITEVQAQDDLNSYLLSKGVDDSFVVGRVPGASTAKWAAVGLATAPAWTTGASQYEPSRGDGTFLLEIPLDHTIDPNKSLVEITGNTGTNTNYRTPTTAFVLERVETDKLVINVQLPSSVEENYGFVLAWKRGSSSSAQWYTYTGNSLREDRHGSYTNIGWQIVEFE